MTLEESVLATRRQLLRAAEQSGNVSATCRLFNVSRAQFYEWRAAWRQYGADGLRPKPTAARPGRPVAEPAIGRAAARGAGHNRVAHPAAARAESSRGAAGRGGVSGRGRQRR